MTEHLRANILHILQYIDESEPIGVIGASDWRTWAAQDLGLPSSLPQYGQVLGDYGEWILLDRNALIGAIIGANKLGPEDVLWLETILTLGLVE